MTRYEYIGDGFLTITLTLEGQQVEVTVGNRSRPVANILRGREILWKTRENDDES